MHALPYEKKIEKEKKFLNKKIKILFEKEYLKQ